jgi:hypothetical protein
MYDIYGHAHRPEFTLTVPGGNGLPEKALKGNWRFIANRKIVPHLVSEEIGRVGYSVTRAKIRLREVV